MKVQSLATLRRKGKRLPRRLTAFLLIGSLFLTISAPEFAAALTPNNQPNTEKEEVVYVDLESTGVVREISVVNRFDLDEKGHIIDYGDYTALRNMTSDDQIVFDDETVQIDTEAQTLYYEGIMSDDTIPWDFSFRYYLDGKEVSAEQLPGQSGALRITVDIQQNTDCNSTFFQNYGLQMSLTLDTEHCQNISAPEATLASVGKNRQLTYTILPNTEAHYTIRADVSDFTMTGININGLPLNIAVGISDEDTQELRDATDQLTAAIDQLEAGTGTLAEGSEALEQGAAQLTDGASQLTDGTDELVDGTEELIDGTEELYDGATDLDDGAAELLDGAISLQGGTDDLAEGAKKLRDGAYELDDGIQQAGDGAADLNDGALDLQKGSHRLYSGAKDLSGGLTNLDRQSGTLTGGSYRVFQQLVAQAETQLNQSLSAAGFPSVQLTPQNYDTVLTNLLDQLAGSAYPQAEAAVQKIVAKEIAEATLAQIIHTLQTDPSAQEQLNQQVEAAYGSQLDSQAKAEVIQAFARANAPDDPNAWLQTAEGQAALSQYLSSAEGQEKITALRQSLKAELINQALQQEAQAQLASEAMQQQMQDVLAQQMSSKEVQQQIADIIAQAMSGNKSYQSILSLKNQLDQYNTFDKGLNQYTNGVGTAADGSLTLLDGIKDLDDGTEDLASGAGELYDGLLDLKDGSEELIDGTEELYNGTKELQDGALELLDGTIELKDGTLSLLDGAIQLQDGTFTLHDGALELHDGTAELLDGTLALHDGTITLCDGVIELHNGTIEFQQETADLDDTLINKINDAINEKLGRGFDGTSFVSDKNTNVDAVQFVMKTDGIQEEETETVSEPNQEPPGFWEKLLNLFS